MINHNLNERIVLRGIEGIISDKYLEEIVRNEWKDASKSDDAFMNQFEAKYMAEQVFSIGKGWA